MPLFGFRKDKKHEQSHIQATAGLAKSAVRTEKDPRKLKSDRPAKTSALTAEKGTVSKSSGVLVKEDHNKAPAMSLGSFSSKTEAIIRPRVTEKSGLLSQGGVYTFEVTSGANKSAVAKAVTAMYKVIPVKIAVINLPSKHIIVRGRRGTVPGIRKAMVTLKKGDKIDFV